MTLCITSVALGTDRRLWEQPPTLTPLPVQVNFLSSCTQSPVDSALNADRHHSVVTTKVWAALFSWRALWFRTGPLCLVSWQSLPYARHSSTCFKMLIVPLFIFLLFQWGRHYCLPQSTDGKTEAQSEEQMCQKITKLASRKSRIVTHEATDTSVSRCRRQENLFYVTVEIWYVNSVKPLDQNMACSHWWHLSARAEVPSSYLIKAL